MSTAFRALKSLQTWLDPVYQAIRNHQIKGYEPETAFGNQPVIQYWQPTREAYVIGVTTEPPGETTYDKQTGIIRSYTRTLHSDNVGHLTRLRENHVTDQFLGNILRFTTSPIYNTPNLPNHKVHLNTKESRSTLEDRLSER